MEKVISMGRCLTVFVTGVLLLVGRPGGAGAQTPASIELDRSEIHGLRHTKPETILELLPRPLPDRYTEEEVREFERRIRNLSLFDSVRVAVGDRQLLVEVLEKFTLVPIVNYSSGKTDKDLDVTAGVAEYNIGGTGTKLAGIFRYTQRRPNFELSLSQHSFHPTRWAKEANLFLNSSSFRFDDSESGWHRDRFGGDLEWKGPYRYATPLRYEVVLRAYREILSDASVAPPRNGYFIGIAPEAIWDRYHWHDLVPSGYRVTLELRPGYFIGPNQNRHEGRLRYLQGVPLGPETVLMLNGVVEAVNSGNVNHSVLIGSQVGVRGLSDNLFRNRAQGYLNTELRHAIKLAPRWALQGVVFSDLGLFQGMDQQGNITSWTGAANVGGGVRLIPTFLSNTLLRLDLARLVAPEQTWFFQYAITQYF